MSEPLTDAELNAVHTFLNSRSRPSWNTDCVCRLLATIAADRREIERLRKVVDAATVGLRLTHEFLPWTLLRKELRELAALDQPTGGGE